MRKSTQRLIQTSTQGKSMIPLIESGSTIVVNMSPHQVYKVGDIVSYLTRKGKIVVHRILYIQETTTGNTVYSCKGDNNLGIDQFIERQCIIGKIHTIIYSSHEIDLTSIWSRAWGVFIALCGRVTGVHQRLYLIGHIIIAVVVKINFLFAKQNSRIES